jgi:hypothetical protein
MSALERAWPGKTEELSDIWSSPGGRSLILWNLPVLEGLQGKQGIAAEARKALARTGSKHEFEKGDSVRIPSRRPPGQQGPVTRVLRVTRADGELRATVRLVKRLRWQVEDAVEEAYRTPDVDLAVPYDDPGALLKVFAGYTDGRKALRTFLEWLLGRPIPARGPDVRQFFVPLSFEEADVRKLAEKKKMACVAIRGTDPEGRVGKMELEGHQQGQGLLPLDFSEPLVRKQDSAPQDKRTYSYRFEHSDGFVEETRVSFVLAGRQPHLSFPLRTSRPAMAQMVTDLRVMVGK